MSIPKRVSDRHSETGDSPSEGEYALTIKRSFLYEKRPCPICESTESRTLFRQTFATLSGIDFLDGYDVVVCGTCGLAFADGIPPQPVLEAYYRNESKYAYGNQGGR